MSMMHRPAPCFLAVPMTSVKTASVRGDDNRDRLVAVIVPTLGACLRVEIDDGGLKTRSPAGPVLARDLLRIAQPWRQSNRYCNTMGSDGSCLGPGPICFVKKSDLPFF